MTKPPSHKLFSYVVEHDYGLAPNPSGKWCSLAVCKFSRSGQRRNVVELAKIGEWIIGTGGANRRTSSGHGTVIYLMRVDEKPEFTEYLLDQRFRGRIDADEHRMHGIFALVSKTFWYFGRNAIPVDEIPCEALEKHGPSHRADFTDATIRSIIQRLKSTYRQGVHGEPCAPIGRARRCTTGPVARLYTLRPCGFNQPTTTTLYR